MRFQRLDEGPNTTLEIEGSLDALTAAELRPVIDDLAEKPEAHVTVELSHLSSIDASGVGALVAIYKRVHENHGEVLLHGLMGQPLAIFRLLKLESLTLA